VITPDEALARLLMLKGPVPIEHVPVADATNRWTAESVTARRTQPARDLSAMDGYAVAHGPGPWTVIGESAAGAPYQGRVAPGEAVRIFTGAALPNGTDTVIIQEDVVRTGDLIAATSTPDQHIRRAGSDFTQGQFLIAAGSRMTPSRIALAVMGGDATIAVRRRVRIALMSTGNELVPPGMDAGPDQLPASNAPMLASVLAALPCDVFDLGIIRDDFASLSDVYQKHDNYDVMVSTGGASVGDHDLVRPALTAAGATLDFWKVAMRPGKPLMAGTLGTTVMLGLPGNPVSAFVTATLFLKPLIAHLSGAADARQQVIVARLATPLPAVGERTDYVRALWDEGLIRPVGGDSGMIVPLASADALIVRWAGAAAAAAGDEVKMISLA
jgi:molybdopterin molybdotransferase